MKKLLILLFFTLPVFGTAQKSTKTISAPRSEKQYVIILSMDAFRWDLASLSQTPTLDSLARVGTYAEVMPVFPSKTFPNHYTMATGLYPDHHGIVNNKFYDKELSRQLSVFDSVDVHTPGFWGGEPVWNTAERQGLKAHIYMWPGSEVPINGRQATVWTRYNSSPSFYQRADWVVQAMSQPEAEIPQLVMWYFEEPDASMHKHGPESAQAIVQAEYIDSVLCYFFREIRRSPVFDRINFIVTADHGMTQLSPERYINLYPLLDTTKVKQALADTSFWLEVEENYVDQALDILRSTGHIRAWQREKIPSRYHYGAHPTRITNIVAIPDTGWTLDYKPTDRPIPGLGAHGFDNYDRDMHMVFYGSGPALRVGHRQPLFENTDIYIILCHLLGIEPAPNDGRWRDVKGMFR